MTFLARPTTFAAALGLSVAIGPAIAGFFLYKGLIGSKTADRYVTVKGLVERIEKADSGILEIAYKVSGNVLSDLNSQLSTDIAKVQDHLKKAGFETQEISQSSPKVIDLHAREYGGNDRLSPERYIIETTTMVKTNKVDLLNSTAGNLGGLISQNVSITRNDVRFALEKFNNLRGELIAEATKNAHEMAKNFALTTGSRIGSIRKANQGVIRIMSPDASPNEEYDSGASSLEKKLRVVSTLEFYLD